MPNDILVVSQLKVSPRAAEVAAELRKLKIVVDDSFFGICDLLLEAQEKHYHAEFGYGQFGDWVEKGSGLDISRATAFYYMNIARKTKKLGLDREQLKEIGVTKLREIFTLDVDQHNVKGLLEDAATKPLRDIKEQVFKIKHKDGTVPHYIALRLDGPVKDLMDQAFSLVKAQHGDSVVEGEAIEISHSKCMEYVCESYLQDPNNYPDGVAREDL